MFWPVSSRFVNGVPSAFLNVDSTPFRATWAEAQASMDETVTSLHAGSGSTTGGVPTEHRRRGLRRCWGDVSISYIEWARHQC